MDDYSKYIKDSSSYITSYEVDNDEIIVNTPKNKKGKVQKYKVTKDKIKYYESKLEKQYKAIIENQDEIVQNKTDLRTTIYIILAIMICVLSALSAGFSEILGMILCGFSLVTLIISSIDYVIYTEKFKAKFKVYADFLRERKKIEKSNVLDENITKNLSNQTSKILSQNQELKERDLIDCIFNINFMDKASLQDLKKILQQHYIAEGIKEKSVIEISESKTKKRSLIKEEQKR